MPRRYWLMKCEPEAYTIDDLARRHRLHEALGGEYRQVSADEDRNGAGYLVAIARRGR